jgi:hypothetical protein
MNGASGMNNYVNGTSLGQPLDLTVLGMNSGTSMVRFTMYAMKIS